MSDEHRRHEEQLERLCSAARALARQPASSWEDRLQLYLELDRFIAAHLAHLDDEERNLLPAVGLEIMPVEGIGRSATALAAEAREAFLQKLWTAITRDEREAIERALPR